MSFFWLIGQSVCCFCLTSQWNRVLRVFFVSISLISALISIISCHLLDWGLFFPNLWVVSLSHLFVLLLFFLSFLFLIVGCYCYKFLFVEWLLRWTDRGWVLLCFNVHFVPVLFLFSLSWFLFWPTHCSLIYCLISMYFCSYRFVCSVKFYLHNGQIWYIQLFFFNFFEICFASQE